MKEYAYRTDCNFLVSPFGMSWVVRDIPAVPDYEVDPNKIQLNIQTGDYFARVSTLLGFLEESIGLCNPDSPLERAQVHAIRAMRKELAYLTKDYRIVPKEGA